MLRFTSPSVTGGGTLSNAPLRLATTRALVAVSWACLLPLAVAGDCGAQGAIGYGGSCFVLATTGKCEEACRSVGLPLPPESCADSCREGYGSSMCSAAECFGCTECLSGAAALHSADFRADVLSLLTSSRMEPNDTVVSELVGCHTDGEIQRLHDLSKNFQAEQEALTGRKDPACLCACAPCEGQGCGFSAESLRRSGLSNNPCVVCTDDVASSCYHDLMCFRALSDKRGGEAIDRLSVDPQAPLRELQAGSTSTTTPSTSTITPSTSTAASTTPVLGFADSIVEILNLTAVDPDLSGFNGGFHDGVFGYIVPEGANGISFGKVVRFNLATFSDVEVLDLAAFSPDLTGFAGGFRSGDYGFLVPRYNGAFFGKVARIALSSFSSVDVLDLEEVDQQLNGFSQGFDDGVYGYMVPNHGSKLVRFHLENFTADDVEVRDLSFAGSDMTGFSGGFHDGTYGYLVPGFSDEGETLGKAVRFDLETFGSASLDILDLTELNPTLAGFQGGFHDGMYGYLVPGHSLGLAVRFDLGTFGNMSLSMLNLTQTNHDLNSFFGGLADPLYGYLVPHGNGLVGRFDFETFSAVEALDLASVHAEMTVFKGGFHDTTYAYVVPYSHGLLARFAVYKEPTTPVPMWNDAEVDMLNLTEIDLSLKGFNGGFHDGRYGYLVPENNGEAFGKVVRFDLATFNDVKLLDVADEDPELKGFAGGFQDGEYGYLVPYNNGGYFGKVVRFDFETFSNVTVLDLSPFLNGTEPQLAGFTRGFLDGAFGYLVPNAGNKLVRFAIANFSSDPTVEVLELFDGEEPLTGFSGGFHDGTYGYLVPGSNSEHEHFGKIVRFELGSFDNTTAVDLLDLLELHPSWQGFQDGYIDGSYGYLVPGNNGEPFGQVVRFSLESFDNFTVISLNSTEANPLLRGFQGGFMDDMYGYLVPHTYGVLGRFNAKSWGDVEALDLTARHPTLTSFKNGFQDGLYGYLVPYSHGTVCRFALWQATTTPESTVTTTPALTFEENLAVLEHQDATAEEKLAALTNAEFQFAGQVLDANTTEVMVMAFDGGKMFAVMFFVDDAGPGGAFHLQTTGPGAVSVPVSVFELAGVQSGVMMYTEMDKDVMNMMPPKNKLFATQFASVSLFDDLGGNLVLPSYLPDHINISLASNSSLDGATCRFFDEAEEAWSTLHVSRHFADHLDGVGMMCQTLHLTLFTGTVDQVFIDSGCYRVEVFSTDGWEKRKEFNPAESGALGLLLLLVIESFLLVVSCLSWQDDAVKSRELWTDEYLLLGSPAKKMKEHADDQDGPFDCENIMEWFGSWFDYRACVDHIIKESMITAVGHYSEVHPEDIHEMDAGDHDKARHPKIGLVQKTAKHVLDDFYDSGFLWRWWMLFRGFHTWWGITRFSVHISAFSRACISAMRMHIALWFTALFFQGTGNVYSYDSGDGCGTVSWGMAWFLAILSCFFSVGVLLAPQLLLPRKYVTKDCQAWDEEAKAWQSWIWWLTECSFAIGAAGLLIFSFMYLVGFHGNIDDATSARWFFAAVFVFLMQILLYPAGLALFYSCGFSYVVYTDDTKAFRVRLQLEERLNIGAYLNSGLKPLGMHKVDSDASADGRMEEGDAKAMPALGDAHFVLQQQDFAMRHPHAVPEEDGQVYKGQAIVNEAMPAARLAQASLEDGDKAGFNDSKHRGEDASALCMAPLHMQSDMKPDTASTLPLDRSAGQQPSKDEAPSFAIRQAAVGEEITPRPVDAQAPPDNVARGGDSEELAGTPQKFASTDQGELASMLRAEVTPVRDSSERSPVVEEDAFPPPPMREQPPPPPEELQPEKARMLSREPQPAPGPLKSPPQRQSPRPPSSEGGGVNIVDVAKPGGPSPARPSAAAGVRAALLGSPAQGHVAINIQDPSPEDSAVECSLVEQEEPTIAVEGGLIESTAVPSPDAIPEEDHASMCRTAPGGAAWAGPILKEPLSPSSDSDPSEPLRPGTSPAGSNVVHPFMAKTYHVSLASVAEAAIVQAAGGEPTGTSGPFASSWPTLTHVLSGQVGANMSEKAQKRAARLSKALEKARQDVAPISQRWAAARNFARAQSQLKHVEVQNIVVDPEDPGTMSPKAKSELHKLQETANKTHENVKGMSDELSETRRALSALMRKTP